MPFKTAFVFPGQGSQRPGMGRDLLAAYPDIVAEAEKVLGWSVAEVCLEDGGARLADTRFAQPAIYTVSALAFLEHCGSADVMAGHSLGEYTALFAAGAVDFATGLRMVKRRGEVMAAAGEGAMAAVTGLSRAAIDEVIAGLGLTAEVVVANHNAPDQLVISGAAGPVRGVLPALEAAGAARVVPLRVRSAFHSPFMAQAAAEYAAFLEGVDLAVPAVPVVSNVSARPHAADPAAIKAALVEHFTAPVRWVDTIQWMRARGVESFTELGHGGVLTALVERICEDPVPADPAAEIDAALAVAAEPVPAGLVAPEAGDPAVLGSAAFRRAHGARWAYVAGGMYQGIASPALVARMGRAGLPAFLGTGGMAPEAVDAAVAALREALPEAAPWGCNLLPDRHERAVVDICIRHGVRRVEAAAYVEMTPDLVRWRVGGLSAAADGGVVIGRMVLGKVSRPEVADAFLAPPPRDMVEALLADGAISAEQAALAAGVPMCDDLIAEADSGGHTDARSPYALLPAFLRLRDAAMVRHGYAEPVRVGAAGGIGTPEAAAAAFLMGADFIVTGSVNQCTVEAGTSDVVKDMLQDMGVNDTAYAPSGQFFESGARVQVLRKGTFFPARAGRLYDLYRDGASVEALDAATRARLEEWFGTTLEAAWADCKAFYPPAEIARAESLPKQRLALVLRWYFGRATRWALSGEGARKADFQVQCGPALGAFNAWVSGTGLEPWRRRHVDTVAEALMRGAAAVVRRRVQALAALEGTEVA